VEKKQNIISEELITLLKRLVANGSIRIAGTVLFVYFKRCWQIDDELAAHYVIRYFQKYYPHQLDNHRKQNIKV
jgi:hypothetical protein